MAINRTARDEPRDQTVHDAAANDSDHLQQLLRKNPQLRDAPGWFGRSPLHVAASAANEKSVKILLNAGADANRPEGLHQDTALAYAVTADSVDCVRLLLRGGADPNRRGARGQTPIFLSRSLPALNQLVEAGAKLDVVDANGDSPIQACASYTGSLEVLRFWVERGADLDAEPVVGWPPLIGIVSPAIPLAKRSESERLEMITWLLDHGASINVQDNQGMTALAYAAENYQHLPQCVQLLLERGADPNLPRKSQETPLHLATQRGYLDVVQMLVTYGADPSVQNIHQVYPLDLCGNHDEIRVLLELITHKQLRPVPTSEAVVDRLKAIPRYAEVAFQGCTEEEINALEERLHVSLPQSYRAFLRTMGHGVDDFMVSDRWTFKIDDLPKIARDKEYEDFCDLPENYFVFADRSGYWWVFFILDGINEDPPVYGFDDGEDRTYRQVARSVWEFIESLVIDYEHWFKDEAK